jgi:carbamoyl-phosphate synthase large subunit
MPRTLAPETDAEIDGFSFPAIVKPATGSGGSAFVFLARDSLEAKTYVTYIRSNGHLPLLQEYVPESEGEYTVGVLSLPNGEVWGAVAMRRLFHSKLSVLMRSEAGLISSGYSQGLIRSEPEIEKTCIAIAKAMHSRGPFNVQGRVKDGVFMPFEINPRFSASTYLRAMAGFHEIDAYICALLNQPVPSAETPRAGYYLRTLSETFVPEGAA